MKYTKNKIVVGLYSMYIADCIFSESQLINYQIINVALTVIRYGVLAAFLILLIRKSATVINKKNLILLVIIVFSVVINCICFMGGSSLLFILVICITVKEYAVRSDYIFKYTNKTILWTTIIVMLLCLAGFLDDVVGSRTLGTELGKFFQGNHIRHSFGFLTANQIPITLFTTYVLRIAYMRDKLKMYEHLIVAVLNVLFLRLFNSRASFILLSASIILYFIVKYIIKNSKRMEVNRKCILWIIYPICAAVSIILAITYNSGVLIWRYINNILMNRITMSNQAIKQYGFSLFGNGISATYTWSDFYSDFTTSTLDNGYINLLIHHGVIVFVVVLLIWCILTFKAQKNGNVYLVIGLVILAVANLIDPYFISCRTISYYCLFVETNSMLLRKKRIFFS